MFLKTASAIPSIIHHEGMKKESLRRLGLFSLERRRLEGDLTAAFQYVKGAYKKDDNFLPGPVVTGNSFKLKEGRFRLDIWNKFFTTSVLRHWNKLPREVVDAPSLKVFKVRLDEALSNLIYPVLQRDDKPQELLALCIAQLQRPLLQTTSTSFRSFDTLKPNPPRSIRHLQGLNKGLCELLHHRKNQDFGCTLVTINASTGSKNDPSWRMYTPHLLQSNTVPALTFLEVAWPPYVFSDITEDAGKRLSRWGHVWKLLKCDMAGRNCHHVLTPDVTSHIPPEHLYRVRQETPLGQFSLLQRLTSDCISTHPLVQALARFAIELLQGARLHPQKLNHPNLAKPCMEQSEHADLQDVGKHKGTHVQR
ncbi:hypothetical protein QYF61_012878 [Mycteria americana]|uniref:Uncharacterized protein n=1 Tax=Mycteria americana TaxID=33587 RepID=A0AAN7RN20_MYCAM|nr:hypothetical protein QYF61_012878 [Mycteria americana]